MDEDSRSIGDVDDGSKHEKNDSAAPQGHNSQSTPIVCVTNMEDSMLEDFDSPEEVRLARKRKFVEENAAKENDAKDACLQVERVVEASPIYKEAWDSIVARNVLSESSVARYKVSKALQDFREIFRNLLTLKESNSEEAERIKRVDVAAFNEFKKRSEGMVHGRTRMGSIPGVEVGDVFHFRVELGLVGLHPRQRTGIDIIKRGRKLLAASIVYHGCYSSFRTRSDVLKYPDTKARTADWKFDRGILALKNNMETRTPFRLTYSFVDHHYKASRDPRAPPMRIPVYIYDGLYLVEDYQLVERGGEPLTPKFRLRRIPGQPQVDVENIVMTERSRADLNVYIKDISHGVEKIPIAAVNGIDNEHPLHFMYTGKLIYHKQHPPTPPSGCDCIGGGCDSQRCACAVKNGGKVPFDESGRIIRARPLVYECGPGCKCPPSCPNRVSQHGLSLPLEIFRTAKRGWGLRCREMILAGTFVCEYAGEVLYEEEAQKRPNDEYLFALGKNYPDESPPRGPSTSMHGRKKRAAIHEDDHEEGFVIDAFAFGNVGRFVNHSCSPNLHGQDLLYDHHDKRMPHIMFFASQNILPFQEITYDYNYIIGNVHDLDGNIKTKECHCESNECRGRLY